MIERLRAADRVHVAAVYDVDERKRHGAAGFYDLEPDLAGPEAVIGHDDVDVVLVLTSMNEHGPLARAALEAGKHVLVEKPMATSARGGGRAARALRALGRAPRLRAAHPPQPDLPRDPRGGASRVEIGRLLNARARYGWAGPDWGEWFYAPGGGSLFDLGVYNVTSLCALFGPARRVTAMVGVAIPEREVNGRVVRVEADDNAQVLLDFGEGRFASVTTGFTMQRYRSPAIELYGSEGTIQLLGDDWAPEGWELWRNAEAPGASSPRATRTGSGRRACATSSTVSRAAGRRSRVPSMPSTRSRSCSRRRRAAATASRAKIESGFPDPVYDDAWSAAEADRYAHDRRSHDGL